MEPKPKPKPSLPNLGLGNPPNQLQGTDSQSQMEYPKEIMFKHPGVYCTQITYSPIDNKLFGTERIEDLNVKKSPKQCAFVCGVQFRVVPNAEDPFEEVCSFKIVCFLDWCFFRICKWDKILLSV